MLIEGERGTGRERVARLLHEIGPRKNHDFVRVDPDEDDEPPRVDDQLARANGGTLLVKEIAHVGRGPQRKLLRAIKRGPGREREKGGTSEFCDVRVIAATGVDLSRAVADELFDPELYERLGALRIALPPLRRRPEDVPLLLEHFGRTEAREIGGDKLSFNSRALDKLTAYSWPGNVAELRDVVRRLCLRRAQEPRGAGATSRRCCRRSKSACRSSSSRSRRWCAPRSARSCSAWKATRSRTCTTRSSRAWSGRSSSWSSSGRATTSSKPPRFWASTATRCARRSPSATSL